MGDTEMTATLDFAGVHNLAARCVNTPLDASTIFSEPDSEGFRTSAWGRIRDRDYDDFLERVRTTAYAVALKSQYVAAWRLKTGHY